MKIHCFKFYCSAKNVKLKKVVEIKRLHDKIFSGLFSKDPCLVLPDARTSICKGLLFCQY